MDAGKAAAIGVALACAVDVAPAAVTGLGLLASASYIESLCDPKSHAYRNKDIESAWNWAWSGKNREQENYYERKIAHEIGSDVFDFALNTAFGAAGYRAGAKAFTTPRYDCTVMESMRHPHLNKPQAESSSSSALRRYIAGDEHALERGHLKLTPHRMVRYENATRHPIHNSKLRDYTTVEPD